jgi:DNA-binding MarR family transcriptional regulator
MERPMPDKPLDHIGWTLWRAALRWRAEFAAGMVAAGHGWFAQARGNLLQHVGPSGLRQADLVRRAGLTKQAVQQFVDELAADGILQREPDPGDARSRILRLTPQGLAAMRDADSIKRAIEARWRAALGEADFARLDALLRRLPAIPDPE